MIYDYLISVARHLEKQLRPRHVVHTLLGYACLFLLPIATSEGNTIFSHGTYIVLDYTTDHLIVAADSRSSHSNGTHSDTDCKITVLGKSALFFHSGNNSAIWPSGKVAYDADAFARRAYRAVFSKNGEKKLSAVADAWASDMDRAYRTQYLTSGERFLSGATSEHKMGIAGFAGGDTGDDSSTVLYLVTNSYSRGSGVAAVRFIHSIARHVGDDSGSTYSFGLEAAVTEFVANTTARARAVHDELQSLNLRPSAEGKAYFLKRFTETVISWSDEPSVGGPISVVILQPGNPIRWFAPGACKTQASQ